ncbi:MAG: peptide chain release factor N(5)-glutamine methyltransferase [Chloroflexi bacterium]|nr:peptide chain release factor N(5)-glutamine methyltransferase [Chloroflexota bacterium]
MTIDETLDLGRNQLSSSPTPQLDARLLLQHILQVPYSYLRAHGDERLTAVQQTQYHHLLHRAQQREPIPYITGHAPFFDFDLQVSPAVLIPRPETEQLVKTAVTWAKSHTNPQPYLVDVGTGSGCIAIAMARQLPDANVAAVDNSAAALVVAQQNAARLAHRRIHFHQGNLLTPITEKVDGIIANLPYVTDGEWTGLDDGVKWYEPSSALKGGPDGLDIIRQLLTQASAKLAPGGAIFLEIGWQQGAAVQQLAQTAFPTAVVKRHLDFGGRDRIVVIEIGD